MSGRPASSRTTSGIEAVRASMASAPVVHQRIWYPNPVTASAMLVPIEGSSSTRRTDVDTVSGYVDLVLIIRQASAVLVGYHRGILLIYCHVDHDRQDERQEDR